MTGIEVAQSISLAVSYGPFEVYAQSFSRNGLKTNPQRQSTNHFPTFRKKLNIMSAGHRPQIKAGSHDIFICGIEFGNQLAVSDQFIFFRLNFYFQNSILVRCSFSLTHDFVIGDHFPVDRLICLCYFICIFELYYRLNTLTLFALCIFITEMSDELFVYSFPDRNGFAEKVFFIRIEHPHGISPDVIISLFISTRGKGDVSCSNAIHSW
ncbi:hypothetical protein D3C85_1011070 [compost metagenome]